LIVLFALCCRLFVTRCVVVCVVGCCAVAYCCLRALLRCCCSVLLRCDLFIRLLRLPLLIPVCSFDSFVGFVSFFPIRVVVVTFVRCCSFVCCCCSAFGCCRCASVYLRWFRCDVVRCLLGVVCCFGRAFVALYVVVDCCSGVVSLLFLPLLFVLRCCCVCCCLRLRCYVVVPFCYFIVTFVVVVLRCYH